MKIKKFICDNCGAPKVNPYKSPYIMCDFCGSFVDIDLTVSFQAMNADPDRAARFEEGSRRIQMESMRCRENQNREHYKKLQAEYWDMYHRLYPEYLPPTVSLDDEHYPQYVDICAKASTDNAFDDHFAAIMRQQHADVQNLEYYNEGDTIRVRPEGFFTMVTHHLDVQRELMNAFYEDPDNVIMHKLLPHGPHLKMKISNLVQGWIPYLTKQDADKLLELTGFSQDYVDIPPVTGADAACEHCGELLFVPEGAIKVYCESCHRFNTIRHNFNCSGCGAANLIPPYPAGTINCESCGAENRLITRNFG